MVDCHNDPLTHAHVRYAHRRHIYSPAPHAPTSADREPRTTTHRNAMADTSSIELADRVDCIFKTYPKFVDEYLKKLSGAIQYGSIAAHIPTLAEVARSSTTLANVIDSACTLGSPNESFDQIPTRVFVEVGRTIIKPALDKWRQRHDIPTLRKSLLGVPSAIVKRVADISNRKYIRGLKPTGAAMPIDDFVALLRPDSHKPDYTTDQLSKLKILADFACSQVRDSGFEPELGQSRISSAARNRGHQEHAYVVDEVRLRQLQDLADTRSVVACRRGTDGGSPVEMKLSEFIRKSDSYDLCDSDDYTNERDQNLPLVGAFKMAEVEVMRRKRDVAQYVSVFKFIKNGGTAKYTPIFHSNDSHIDRTADEIMMLDINNLIITVVDMSNDDGHHVTKKFKYNNFRLLKVPNGRIKVISTTKAQGFIIRPEARAKLEAQHGELVGLEDVAADQSHSTALIRTSARNNKDKDGTHHRHAHNGHDSSALAHRYRSSGAQEDGNLTLRLVCNRGNDRARSRCLAARDLNSDILETHDLTDAYIDNGHLVRCLKEADLEGDDDGDGDQKNIPSSGFTSSFRRVFGGRFGGSFLPDVEPLTRKELREFRDMFVMIYGTGTGKQPPAETIRTLSTAKRRLLFRGLVIMCQYINGYLKGYVGNIGAAGRLASKAQLEPIFRPGQSSVASMIRQTYKDDDEEHNAMMRSAVATFGHGCMCKRSLKNSLTTTQQYQGAIASSSCNDERSLCTVSDFRREQQLTYARELFKRIRAHAGYMMNADESSVPSDKVLFYRWLVANHRQVFDGGHIIVVLAPSDALFNGADADQIRASYGRFVFVWNADNNTLLNRGSLKSVSGDVVELSEVVFLEETDRSDLVTTLLSTGHDSSTNGVIIKIITETSGIL